MTILIGLAPGHKDDSAVNLGCVLARSSAEDVVVVSVVPAPWPPDPYGGDKEYLAYQEDLAEKTLLRARAHLDDRVTGTEYLGARRAAGHDRGRALQLGRGRLVVDGIAGPGDAGGCG
jgi:hypothetical protein